MPRFTFPLSPRRPGFYAANPLSRSVVRALQLGAALLVFVGLVLASQRGHAQAAGVGGEGPAITGTLFDDAGAPVAYANLVLHLAADSSIQKVEVTDDAGAFAFYGVPAGRYFAVAKYVGSPDLRTEPFDARFGDSLSLGRLTLKPAGVELAAATVTAQRRIVEIKPDRTVFNVEGTINAAGGDGMSLLRKAPGVVVDNNDNLIVMGRAGVLVYIDGKRSPLSGEALTAFLRGLPAEQIDRIDIITNPGAKYEAEGNAGIIDIRLKKNENWGSNGSVSTTASQGEHFRGNVSGTVNHREGAWNTFATGGVYTGDNFNDNFFDRTQNGLFIADDLRNRNSWRGGNLKLGTDYRLGDRHTFGVLANANYNVSNNTAVTRAAFARAATPTRVDSVLVSRSTDDGDRVNASGNLNYRYDDAKGTTVNVDLDYGAFRREMARTLPSQFFGPDGDTPLSTIELAFDTPSDIDIYTATLDYEQPAWGGKLSAGAKYTRVVSDNTFRFMEMIGGEPRVNGARSNVFVYDEAVSAGYASYLHDFGPAAPGGQGKALSFSAGLRLEHTRAQGDLTVLDGSPETSPVDRDYVNLFPNAGLTWAAAPKHTLALSYGRRINRPDYENLNPFLGFASLVIFEQGNPMLRPEIVNSLELSHTFAYRYTTKLSVSRTEDQITRLIRQASFDERGQYITWDNLTEQTVVALNVSVPAQIAKWWETYFTATGNYTENQAVYDNDGATEVIDLSAYNFNVYNQHTFSVGGGWKAEVSGWFSGPGIWGGTFETEAMGSLNVGAQRKFMGDKLRLRVAVDDLLFTNGWRGFSDFGGTTFDGGGNWDSRRASVSLTYNFGNEKVKSRQRRTGLDDAAGRVGG